VKPEQTRNIKLTLLALLTVTTLNAEAIAAEAPVHATAAPSAVFAKVGDTVILQQDYDAAFAAGMRKKFYHGRVPEGGAAAMQREVGDTLVTNALLLQEAKRRSLKPDDAAIQQTIEQYDKRYHDSKQWQQTRAQFVPTLTKQLQQESLLSQLENLIRNVPQPDVKQIQEYYTANPDKFTEPEQLQLSVILLKVDPSSPPAVWDKTRADALDLIKKLRNGADFATLARKHSGDSSSEKGGDLGYLHQGMLPQGAQENVDKLKPGEISEPVRLLEGVAIFRLNDRKPPKLNDFETSRERARDLWLREQGERSWTAFIARLKKETPIQVDESRYLPVPAANGEHAIKK